MSLKTYLIIAAFVGGFLLTGIVTWKISQWEKAVAENKTLKSENKEIRNEAQSYANKPKSNDDLVISLCNGSIEAAKSDRSADSELLGWCRKRVR